MKQQRGTFTHRTFVIRDRRIVRTTIAAHRCTASHSATRSGEVSRRPRTTPVREPAQAGMTEPTGGIEASQDRGHAGS